MKFPYRAVEYDILYIYLMIKQKITAVRTFPIKKEVDR